MSPVVVDCCYIDHDGEWYGPKSTRFIITEYTGKKKIASLEIYPAEFDKDRIATERALQERGQRFVDFSASQHHNYSGRTLQDDYCPNGVEQDVHCECVIDHSHMFGSDFDFRDNYISKRTEGEARELAEVGIVCGVPDCTTCTDLFDDDDIDRKYREDFLESDAGTQLLEVNKGDIIGRDDEQRKILLPARVFGYALADRAWLALDINCFTEKQNDRSFEDLVIPKRHKTLLQALVKNHMRDSVSGRGLIILLHGVPGVGKTSTAESVASELGRPLFPITCGDLGTDARQVEDSLETFFRLAAKWKCVLLLDEADVFLARRTQGDVQRNGLVSVFLRVLEYYYAGILILTTNRVGEFDEAFRSRIHVSLYYPRLDEKSTEEIWLLNIRRVKQNKALDMDVRESEIMAFCKKHWEENKAIAGRLWNGRQIKNAFQTAIALANWDFFDTSNRKTNTRPNLEAVHFRYVAETSSGFDNYLDEVHKPSEPGGAYSDIAASHKLRQDSYGEPKAHANGHEASTPSRRPQSRWTPTPRNSSSHVATVDSAAIDANAEKIQSLKRKLKAIDKNKNFSADKREEMKFNVQLELEELGEKMVDSDAEGGALGEEEESSPWG